MKNPVAMTPAMSPYPPYINVSVDGDKVTVILRSNPKLENGVWICGITANAVFTKADWDYFLAQL